MAFKVESHASCTCRLTAVALPLGVRGIEMDAYGRDDAPFAFFACIFGMLEQRETFLRVCSILIYWSVRLARRLGSLLREESLTRRDPSSRQGLKRCKCKVETRMTPLLEMKAREIRPEGCWMGQRWGDCALSLVSLGGPAVTAATYSCATANVSTGALTMSRLPPPTSFQILMF